MTPEEMNTKYGKPPITPSAKGVVNPFASRWASPSDEFLGSHVSQSYDINPNTGKPIGAFSAGARNVGKALIGSEIGLGQTLGQSMAVNTKDFSGAAESAQGLSDMQLKVVKLINEKKARGEDTSRLERSLQSTSGKESIDIQGIAPASQKTSLQAVGELGGTALDLASVGTFKGVSTIAKTAKTAQEAKDAYNALTLSGKLASIGKDTFKFAATGGMLGYGYDVTGNLREGATGTEAIKPGLGTAIGVGVPALIGGMRATKAVVGAVLPHVSTNLSGVPKGAYDQMINPEKSSFTGIDANTTKYHIANSQSFPVQSELAKGSIPRSQIYTKGDILTPKFAQGRVEDIAGKLENYKKGLGDEFRTMVDIKNVSMKGDVPEELVKIAQDLVDKNPITDVSTNVISQIGKVTPSGVLSEARDSQSLFNKTIQHNFGESKKKIIEKFNGVRIGLNNNEQAGLKKISTEFGFADRLPQNLSNMSAKESMDLLSEINYVNPITSLDTPLVKNYKLALSELKDAIKTKAVSQFGGEQGIFDKTYQAYAEGKKILKDVSSIIGKPGITLTPVQQVTAKNRLMKIFNEDKDAYLSAIRTLEEKTGTNLIDKVAASHLSPILPKTLRGGQTGVIGLASDLLGMAIFPLSSPRISSWLISKVVGVNPSTVSKILNLSPKLRETIYNAVNKENLTLDNALRKYTTEFKNMPNKEGGFADFGVGGQRLSESNQSKTPLTMATNQTKPINTNNAVNIVDDTTTLTPKSQFEGLSPKAQEIKSQGIRLTPEIRAKIKGESLKREDLVNKSESGKETSPLIQEAKKYKSAEDIIVYRGGEKFDPSKMKTSGKAMGSYFSTDENFAKGFTEDILSGKTGKGLKDVNTYKYTIKKGATILDKENIPARFIPKDLKELVDKFGSPHGLQDAIAKWAKQNGFDAIDYSGNGKNIIVINPNIIK